MHAATGAIEGFILGGNKTAAIAGAVGAVVAEVCIEAMVSDEDIKNTPQDKIAEKFQLHMFVAKLVGGVAGGLVGNFDVGM